MICRFSQSETLSFIGELFSAFYRLNYVFSLFKVRKLWDCPHYYYGIVFLSYYLLLRTEKNNFICAAK